MLEEEKPLSNRLYRKISIFSFLLFLIVLMMVAVIMTIVMFTPLKLILIRGFASTTVFTLVVSYLASALVSSFLSFFTAKKFLYPLADLSNKSMKVAKGDFSVKVTGTSNIPELAELMHNFNIMVDELSKVETLSNDFVSNVSHEFKTPLSVIRSNVNILENTDLNEEERKKCLRAINESTDKLSTLVSNVLRISKLDNQNVRLEKKPFRLDEQIRQCVLSLNESIEKRGIELNIDLDDCILNSDESLLIHVWTNLLTNAIKFTKDRIDIALSVHETIRVSIRDNGIGMNEETCAHIFDRFYQGETSHSHEGNGLGLTIVSKILRLFNASIRVESKEGEGSTFIVDFPLDTEEK